MARRQAEGREEVSRMQDMEKIIMGLECCSVKQSCLKCPWAGKDCNDRLHLAILEILKEQQETIELQGSLLTLAHAALTHGKKEGLKDGARPGRNRENPASHV